MQRLSASTCRVLQPNDPSARGTRSEPVAQEGADAVEPSKVCLWHLCPQLTSMTVSPLLLRVLAEPAW